MKRQTASLWLSQSHPHVCGKQRYISGGHETPTGTNYGWKSVPHARGDGPQRALLLRPPPRCSPCTRGWTARVCFCRPGAFGVPPARGDGPNILRLRPPPFECSPMHAGMDRQFSSSSIRQFHVPPCTRGWTGSRRGECSPCTRGWTEKSRIHPRPGNMFPLHARMER